MADPVALPLEFAEDVVVVSDVSGPIPLAKVGVELHFSGRTVKPSRLTAADAIPFSQ